MATALAIGSAADASAIAFDPSGYQARNDKSNPFRFMPTAERLNTITQQKINNTLGIKSVQDLDPDIILSAPYSSEDQMRTCGVVYGPHEENWFYTMVPLYDELPGSNEYWKNVSFTGVIFTLYNEKAEKIGSFTGNVPLIEGALKCQSVQVDLSVTQKFYNLDDKYEITIAANYNPLKGAGAKQVTYSYSLNNKEEAQDPICTRHAGIRNKHRHQLIRELHHYVHGFKHMAGRSQRSKLLGIHQSRIRHKRPTENPGLPGDLDQRLRDNTDADDIKREQDLLWMGRI